MSLLETARMGGRCSFLQTEHQFHFDAIDRFAISNTKWGGESNSLCHFGNYTRRWQKEGHQHFPPPSVMEISFHSSIVYLSICCN